MNKTLRAVLCAGGVALATPALASITLYEQDNYHGRSFSVEDTVMNLERFGFNDRASSAKVRRQSYTLCDDAGLRGRCVTLAPGDYSSLRAMGLANRVSSAAPADARGPGPGPRPGADAGPVPGPVPGPGRGRGARAMLFGDVQLQGPAFVIEGDQVVRNLDRTRFNDRASSLRVERGYWMFCSDADFQGDCLTFGPGDYPNLPDELNNRVSSGRVISERYPYRERPDWKRY